MIDSREQIPTLLSENSIGCELGVFLGEYSEILLSSKKFNRLYLVDTFDGQIGSGDKYGNNMRILGGEYLLANAIHKFQNHNTIEIIKSDSIKFLKNCNSNFFDFIYIDTVHTYKHLMQELQESRRVIKLNGFICGHDYNKNIFPEVVTAVNDFCQMYNYTFYTTTKDILESFIITK